MNEWYYADEQQQRQGPVDVATLARLRGEGVLGWDSLVWRDGMAEWKPLSEFAGLFAGDDPPSAPVAGGSGAATPAFTAAPASPHAPPTAPLQSTAAIHSGHDIVYAGFWKRVAAYLIDGVIAGVIGAIVGGTIGAAVGFSIGARGGSFDTGQGFALQAVMQAISFVLSMVYFAWFHSSHLQATPGKLAIGLKVVRSDGKRIGFLRGIARYLGLIVSILILCIGLIMAGFTARKQALHDLMCDTLVVDKWAFTDRPELQRRELGTLTIVVLVVGGVLFAAAIALLLFAVGMVARYAH